MVCFLNHIIFTCQSKATGLFYFGSKPLRGFEYKLDDQNYVLRGFIWRWHEGKIGVSKKIIVYPKVRNESAVKWWQLEWKGNDECKINFRVKFN